MKKLLFLICLFLAHILKAQTIDMKQINKFCKSDTETCGPWDKLDQTEKIIGENTSLKPFPFILHIETQRNYIITKKIDYGTVSFISENTLITAWHVVGKKGILNQIRLAGTSTADDNWITFSKDEFEILYYDKKNNVETDLAVIRLLNKEKTKSLYKGIFMLDKLENPIFNKSDKVNLTGYPCYFADTPENHDNLVNKSTTIESLNLLNSHYIGYKIFTCIGDSGAPLWIKKNEQYFIVGIHHGGGEDGGFYDESNISVKLTDDMLKWLKMITTNNTHFK